MKNQSRLRRCVLLLLVLTGCGGTKDPWKDKRPKTTAVSGRVTYKGNPLDEAVITFHADSGNVTSYGRTDQKGQFKLTTFEPDDGATIGSHKVAIQKFENLPLPEDPEAAPRAGPKAEPKSLIPERYGNVKSSTLTAAVSEDGENEFVFELN